MTLPGSYGNGIYGSDPYGSNFLAVVSVTVLDPTQVEVTFNWFLDFTYPEIVSPTNYTITPSLNVLSVTANSLNSVILRTDRLVLPTYEVQVGFGKSLTGLPLNPALSYEFFTGFPPPTFIAAGMTPTRVRLLFSAPMLINSVLTDPASYEVTTLQGVPLAILSAVPEQSVNPLSVILTLAAPGMGTTEWYQAVIVGDVQTTSGLAPNPLQHVFQFIEPAGSFRVDPQNFTGEVQGGLFGYPNGLVFFSPALEVPISNSILQVEDIDVCSTAYDTYHFPKPIDPFPLFTWSPHAPQTTLGQTGVVLWAGFPRLSDARLELTFTGSHMVEPMPTTVDSGCSITMQQTWDPAYVALLNDPAWYLYNDTGTSVPPMFICANNLAPIPPGASVSFTILRTAFGGTSSTQSVLDLTLGPTGNLGGVASVGANLTVT